MHDISLADWLAAPPDPSVLKEKKKRKKKLGITFQILNLKAYWGDSLMYMYIYFDIDIYLSF